MIAYHRRDFLPFKFVLSIVGAEVLAIVHILVCVVYDLVPIAEAKENKRREDPIGPIEDCETPAC